MGYFSILPFQDFLGEAKAVVPFVPAISIVLSALVKWFTQGSLSVGKTVQKQPIFQQKAGEDRQSYYLNIKRIRGKERPKQCQGRLELKEENIDDYGVWRTTGNRFCDIGTDDDLLLFEILNGSDIIIRRDSKSSIQDSYDKFKDTHVTVRVDAENMKPCRPYKKKISDIVKSAKSAT